MRLNIKKYLNTKQLLLLLGKKAVTVRFTIGSYTDTLTKEQIDKERETVLTTLKAKGMTIAE